MEPVETSFQRREMIRDGLCSRAGNVGLLVQEFQLCRVKFIRGCGELLMTNWVPLLMRMLMLVTTIVLMLLHVLADLFSHSELQKPLTRD